jgi:hypothetical protein
MENAKTKHDAAEHLIKFNYTKNQAAIAPRFSPLMDKDGRVYYIHTPSLRKPPAKSTRDEFMKWTWFIAVWGKRPDDATRVDEAQDTDNDEEGWWAFGDAKECKQLADWLQWRDGEGKEKEDLQEQLFDGKLSDSENSEESDKDATTSSDSKRLVAAILDFANVLQYADDVVAK